MLVLFTPYLNLPPQGGKGASSPLEGEGLRPDPVGTKGWGVGSDRLQYAENGGSVAAGQGSVKRVSYKWLKCPRNIPLSWFHKRER